MSKHPKNGVWILVFLSKLNFGGFRNDFDRNSDIFGVFYFSPFTLLPVWDAKISSQGKRGRKTNCNAPSYFK